MHQNDIKGQEQVKQWREFEQRYRSAWSAEFDTPSGCFYILKNLEGLFCLDRTIDVFIQVA
jgi:hypothetical protein